MEQKTVLLGMSGGVDSSVAALLLKKQGYKVIGAFMRNFSETKNKLTGECSWIEERKVAQKIASLLSIPLITLDYEKEYKKYVIDPMFKAYKQGLTPNPDVSCNTIIKFPLLWKKARELKADFIATGHYVRIIKDKKGFSLLKGKDDTKDQSYFLYELTQFDLSHTLFPLGNLKKEKVRMIAKSNKFLNWDKLGSRGICFVGKINMKNFLSQRIKKKTGKIVDPDGKVIGTHPGIAYFTIGEKLGQRIGVEIHKPSELATKRWYVAKVLRNNTIVAAPENHPILKTSKIIIHKLKIINKKEKLPSLLSVRIRHLGRFHKGKLTRKDGKDIFTFKVPQEQIAQGQSIVLYNKDKVLGGGEIRLK